MGVRVPLRAQHFPQFSMNERTKQKAGLVRWLTVGAVCYGSWIIVLLVLVCLYPGIMLVGFAGRKPGRAAVRRFLTGFLRLYFLGFFSFIGVLKVGERPNPDAFASRGNHLFAVNHRSWLDGLLLLALIPNVSVPVNASYTRAPLLGPLMIWLGCIPLDRKSPETTLEGIRGVQKSVKEKRAVAVFPEGRRSEPGRLKPFSSFFFRIACEEGTPVSPLILHLDHPFLGPGAENFLTAGRANLTIRLLDPIAPQKGERGSELGRRVHKKMAVELRKLD